ncbi:unnamed protein product [Discosporangium mesarthrocarpum]
MRKTAGGTCTLALAVMALVGKQVFAFIPSSGLRLARSTSVVQSLAWDLLSLKMSSDVGSSAELLDLAQNVVGIPPVNGVRPESGQPLGRVSLVGSGPGDPELLTLAAIRALDSADLVIADRLVSKEILDLVPGDLRVARKYPGCAEEAQHEIYRWMREGIAAGKHVVRLKIGDPFIFGRGGEEVLEMRKDGIECRVIPGISSVFSAPLLGGIPVTHRGVASQVTLGTGYGKDYSHPDICDYHPQKTAVFLMAIGRLRELCDDMLRRGYPEDCPVAIVENASTPRQRVIAATVNTILDVARDLEVKPPSTIVVGEVVRILHGDVKGLVPNVSFQPLAAAAAGAGMRAGGVKAAGMTMQLEGPSLVQSVAS